MHSLSKLLQHRFDEEKPLSFVDIARNLTSNPLELKYVLCYDDTLHNGCVRDLYMSKTFLKHARHNKFVLLLRDTQDQLTLIKIYNELQDEARGMAVLIDDLLEESQYELQYEAHSVAGFSVGKTIVSYLVDGVPSTDNAHCYLNKSILNDFKYRWFAIGGNNGGMGYCTVCTYEFENHGLPLYYWDKNELDYHASRIEHISNMAEWEGPLNVTNEETDSE